MKIFISIKKKWLQHRVYKYTLKYQDTLSKSDYFSKMSTTYNSAAEHADRTYGRDYNECRNLHKMAADYSLKSSYQKNLSEMYLNKKLDLEEELNSLSYRKA